MGGRELTLTLVNVVPYTAMRNGKLDGYRIGEYAAQPLKGLEQYERPKGFVRLADHNDDLWVSDHYRMRDFQCKLDGTTKFLVLRTDALVKLEILQHELLIRHNLKFDRFTIMSGYRTPYYNAKIGNETGYSRHLYGDAMDIYIDQNADGKMDDVNRDGRIVGRSFRAIHTGGAYGGLKANSSLATWHYVGVPYRVENSHFEFLQIYTNTVPGGYYRSPGAVAMAFALESHTDLIAAEIGMDPAEFRLKNLLAEGEEDASRPRADPRQ